MTKNKFIAKTATEGIRILWSENFFQEWKKAPDITELFSKRHHHFYDAELGMALNRAKFLTRRGKRRNYEYIQKYPFAKEEEDGGNKKRK
jgi:hypothetical protein